VELELIADNNQQLRILINKIEEVAGRIVWERLSMQKN
jgi:hypothetical protein